MVDLVEVKFVLDCLEILGVDLVIIYNIYYYGDYVGVNWELLVKYFNLEVYGGVED